MQLVSGLFALSSLRRGFLSFHQCRKGEKAGKCNKMEEELQKGDFLTSLPVEESRRRRRRRRRSQSPLADVAALR